MTSSRLTDQMVLVPHLRNISPELHSRRYCLSRLSEYIGTNQWPTPPQIPNQKPYIFVVSLCSPQISPIIIWNWRALPEDVFVTWKKTKTMVISLTLDYMGLKLLRIHLADNWYFINFEGIKLKNWPLGLKSKGENALWTTGKYDINYDINYEMNYKLRHERQTTWRSTALPDFSIARGDSSKQWKDIRFWSQPDFDSNSGTSMILGKSHFSKGWFH